MIQALPALIDKTDNIELVRDQIGAILSANSVAQQGLAAAAGKSPQDFKLRVFVERSAPWEMFRDDPIDTSPVVNVWLSSWAYPKALGNSVGRQGVEATYNIDILGYGKTDGVIGLRQNPGDQTAAFESQRGARLVRNILMADQNTYLQMQGTVGGRWIESASTFQPGNSEDSAEDIVATRLVFSVLLNEFSPQDAGVTLERVFVDIVRAGDGFIEASADYDYTV